MRKIIVCDHDKCTGCRVCEYACAAHQDDSLDVRTSRIKSVRVEPIFNVAISCVACDEPDCIAGCPVQAITWDDKKKHIVIDLDKCDSCGLCAERCKFGSITIKEKGAFVCDFCADFDTPKCVEFCPKEALTFKKPNDKEFQGRVRDV